MCVASSSQGIPPALTTPFSLALPWWMPSPFLFAVFGSKGSSLVILAFLFSQLDAVTCHRSVPKLHLLAGSLIFADRSPCSWGLPGPVSKTYPWSKPKRVTLSLLPHSPGNNCFPGQWAAWSPGFLLSWSLQWVITPSMYYGLFKYSQHGQASRSRNLKNIITVILLQFQSFFSRVDFSELLHITSLLHSPVSVECDSLSPSDSINRGSYIMLPCTHSQIFIKDLNQALFNGLEI